MLIEFDQNINLLLIVKVLFIDSFVLVLDLRVKANLCNSSNCINVFLYSLSITSWNLWAKAQELIILERKQEIFARYKFKIVKFDLY
jgi:hypothetical protein